GIGGEGELVVAQTDEGSHRRQRVVFAQTQPKNDADRREREDSEERHDGYQPGGDERHLAGIAGWPRAARRPRLRGDLERGDGQAALAFRATARRTRRSWR